MQVELKVNGKPVSADVPPNTLLVQLLREHLRLTGTHVGCDTAQCGACTVMADGRAIKSCNVLALQMQRTAELRTGLPWARLAQAGACQRSCRLGFVTIPPIDVAWWW